MKFYDNDPFAESKELLEQQQSDERLTQKLRILFTPKPFSQRWKQTNNAGVVLSYLCNILSGLTALTIITFLVYQGLRPTLGLIPAITASALLSVSVVAASEVIKRHSLNNFLRNLIQFKQFSFPLFAFVLSACSVSVLTSFYGAKQIPQLATTLSKPKNAELKTAVVDLEKQITELQKEKQEYFENNKKPNNFGGYRLSSKYMSTYNNMISDISTLKQTKTLVLEDARELALVREKTIKKENTKLSQTLGYFALGVELIFILSILGVWFYYWNSYKERLSSQPTPAQRTGEEEGENSSDENRQGTKDENRQRNRTCENCGKSYVHKHHKQKYCTDDCRKEAWKRKAKNESQPRRKKGK